MYTSQGKERNSIIETGPEKSLKVCDFEIFKTLQFKSFHCPQATEQTVIYEEVSSHMHACARFMPHLLSSSSCAMSTHTILHFFNFFSNAKWCRRVQLSNEGG